MPDTFIVGYDGTEQSQRAVDFAQKLAKDSGAALHLVWVLEWSPYSFLTPEELGERHKRRKEEVGRAEASIAPVAKKLQGQGVKADFEVCYGHAGELLCEIASKMKAAQIIVGRTGQSGLSQRLLGGLTLTLVQASPVPVTVVP